jgi:esterase/lipase superfamily enzyme
MFMSLRRSISAVGVVLALVNLAGAAALIDLRLQTDGSADPPGDRLDLVISFAPGETQLTVEVDAVVAAAAPQGTVQRVKAAGQRHRDRDGRYRQSQVFDRPAEAAAGRYSVVVAYRDLKLAPGVHLLAYEARGVAAGRVQFVRATRLTEVTVSEKIRTSLTRVVTDARANPVVTSVSAYRLNDPTVPIQPLDLKTTRYSEVQRTSTHEVVIPGEFLRAELGEIAKGEVNQAEPWIALAELKPKNERTVYFATNRKPSEKGHFGGDLDSTTRHGACVVNFPVDSHQRGSLEIPPNVRNWWKKYDPKKFFYIYACRTLGQQQLIGEVAEDDLLLYIHGFNTSFRHAILTATQLKHDTEFAGRVAIFTWPSDRRSGENLLTGYRSCEVRAAKSVQPLSELLTALVARKSPEGKHTRLHVIAHSLGNRLLLAAVHQLVTDRRIKPSQKVFSNVVLAAADVDWPTFASQAPSLVSCSERISYYYSTEDFPLKLSKSLHGNRPPIGLCPLFHPHVDTINADNVNQLSVGFGHRYFSSSNPMLVDLSLLVVGGLAPNKRQPPLGNRQAIGPYLHWEFVPLEP